MQTHRKDAGPRPAAYDFDRAGHARTAEVRSPFEARRVFDDVEAWMRFFGYPRLDIFAFRLALEEAVANALQHGRLGDGGRTVTIMYAVQPDEAIARVTDDGGGFDPAQVPNPLANGKFERAKGLGLFLMRAYTSWVHFNAEGNCVTLCRQKTLF